MQRLLFDVGNTRIKWAWDDGTALVERGEALHRDAPWPDLALPYKPREIYAVNVAGPEVAAALDEDMQRRFGITVRYAHTGPVCGSVRNGYTAYEQLGVDRWAAVIGAWHLCRTDICVVDAGTAVTIDLVDADGSHRGGIILPGLGLMAAALNRDTSDIEGFAAATRGDVPEGDWYGRDTATAVRRGAHFALSSAIVAAAEGRPLVLTGGDAHRFVTLEGLEIRSEPLLVLEGLRRMVAEPGGLGDA